MRIFLIINLIYSTKPKEFNYKTFKKEILLKKNYSTLIILFSNFTDIKFKKKQKIFHDLMKNVSSNVEFGIVDSHKNIQLTEDCGLNASNSNILIFYMNKTIKYEGKFKFNKLLKFIYELDSSRILKVDENWNIFNPTNNFAILFDNSTEIPKFWKILSNHFYKENITFGFSNNITIMDYFNIGDLPCLMIFNSTFSYKYTNNFKFSILKNTIQNFYNKKFIYSTNINNFKYNSYFLEDCIGKRDFCIIDASDDIDYYFEQFLKKYPSNNIKWFYGEKDWPFNIIKANTKWIYNPKKNEIAEILKKSEINDILLNISNSNLKWIKL